MKALIFLPITLLLLFLIKKFKFNGGKKKETKTVGGQVQQILKNKFSMSNQKFIDTLHPAVRADFINFLKDVEGLGYTPIITAAIRTFQRSAELKKEDSRNASPGYSAHNYGMALDLVLSKDKKLIQKNAPRADWIATGVPNLARTKYGMRWGGDFPGYPDNVHFDYQNKYPTKELLAQGIKQFGSIDKIIGNEVKVA